ncbi:MAG: hypothetical protein ACREBI_07885 [Nitrosotalea sp.]
MKILHLSIITIVSITVIVATSIGVFIEKLGENQQQPYTVITINGVKENYTVKEPVAFSVAIEGYGTGCGDTKAIITKENDTQFKSTEWYSTVQCAAFANPNYFKFYRLSENTSINQTGSYILTASFNDSITYRHTSTERKFSVTLPKNTTIYDTGIFPLSVKVTNTNSTVNYNIRGGQISEIKLDNQSRSLVILLQTDENGTITIDLPRALIDAKTYENMDDKFIVLEDGQEVLYNEIHKTMQDRTLSIPFQHGIEKIEIIGATLI